MSEISIVVSASSPVGDIIALRWCDRNTQTSVRPHPLMLAHRPQQSVRRTRTRRRACDERLPAANASTAAHAVATTILDTTAGLTVAAAHAWPWQNAAAHANSPHSECDRSRGRSRTSLATIVMSRRRSSVPSTLSPRRRCGECCPHTRHDCQHSSALVSAHDPNVKLPATHAGSRDVLRAPRLH